MLAGRIVCCRLVSHVEYASRILFRLEQRRDRQTDGRTPDSYITLTAGRGHRNDQHGVVRCEEKETKNSSRLRSRCRVSSAATVPCSIHAQPAGHMDVACCCCCCCWHELLSRRLARYWSAGVRAAPGAFETTQSPRSGLDSQMHNVIITLRVSKINKAMDCHICRSSRL